MKEVREQIMWKLDGRTSQVEAIAGAKALVQEHTWHISWAAKEATVAEVECVRQEGSGGWN